MQQTHASRFTLLGFLSFILWTNPAAAQVFVDDSFEDFRAGTLDASGQNIYISRDGKIRTIHHFDYDQDGYIDILLPQTHDTYSQIPPVAYTFTRDRKLTRQELAIRGAQLATAGDLDRDGFQDLAFCPNYNGTQHPRDFLSIAYGGPDGWPAARTRAALPVHGAISLAIADLNHDHWPDIVSLNSSAWKHSQSPGAVVRVYWGGPRGYLPARSTDLSVKGAQALASGDLNADGFADLALLRKDSNILIFHTGMSSQPLSVDQATIIPLKMPGQAMFTGDANNDNITDLVMATTDDQLLLLAGSQQGLSSRPTTLYQGKSSHASFQDLDGDGYNDLMISYLATGKAMGGEMMGAAAHSGQSLNILWGSKQGFSNHASTQLSAPQLSKAVSGDFDGDGRPDIAIAINKGKEHFTTTSLVYFGKGDRQFEPSYEPIITTGASDVMAVKNSAGQPDKIVFCNSTGGTVDERVPAYLYWGGPNGFLQRPRTEIPFRSGYECSAADFNADGYPDITIMDEMHGGQGIDDDPLAGANLFWGGPNGFDFSLEARTVLSESYLGSSNVADLNKDGWLDLVLGQFTVDGHASSVIIYYGGKEGFSKLHRTTIPCTGRSLGIQLADYNKDGWLDIAANALSEDLVRIFLGSEQGYDLRRSWELDVPAVSDLETADLNQDGWLDLIATSYDDMSDPNHNDMGTTIFWGSNLGFRPSHAQWLPGYTPLGPVVADFDADGYLDLFGPSYHAALTRESIPSFLYWGGPNGFQPQHRTVLIHDSGAEGLAADFDKDGRLDLFVSNHATNGGHQAFSKVLFNDGKRFSQPRVALLETRGPHWSHNEDMGHIYDRSWKQAFISRKMMLPSARRSGRIEYKAQVPAGTTLALQVRSSTNSNDLDMASWRAVGPSGQFEIQPSDRCMQYKAVFISDNGDRYPVLDKVSITIHR